MSWSIDLLAFQSQLDLLILNQLLRTFFNLLLWRPLNRPWVILLDNLFVNVIKIDLKCFFVQVFGLKSVEWVLNFAFLIFGLQGFPEYLKHSFIDRLIKRNLSHIDEIMVVQLTIVILQFKKQFPELDEEYLKLLVLHIVVENHAHQVEGLVLRVDIHLLEDRQLRVVN